MDVPLNEDGDIDQTAFVRFAKAQETFARVQTQEQARKHDGDRVLMAHARLSP